MSSEDESVGNGIEDDLEIIEEGVETIEEANEVAENFIEQAEVNNELGTENQQDTETESKKVVKPKRVIKNPQPKLNELTLQGPKGLSAIEGYFDRVKFKGRGYEEKDLDVLLKTYEYWCHRLFPKFPFDNCIERLEKLGTKRGTQTEIKRIRMGITSLDPDRPIVSDEEENHTGGFVDTYNDQFDQLLPSTSIEPEPEITDEQIERIRLNKERAERLRQERLKKIQEKAKISLEQSNEIITQNDKPSTSTSNPTQKGIGGDSHNSQADKNQVEDEDNIENILDFINAEEETTTKNKKPAIESDSEDEIIGKRNEKVVTKLHILESDEDEDEEISTQNETDKCKDNKITEEDEDDDIENILTEINTDDNIATTNVINEEYKDDHINFDKETLSVKSDSVKKNATKDVSEIKQLENIQIRSCKSKLSDTNKIKHFSGSKEDEQIVQDNNGMIIPNGNAIDDFVSDEQTADNNIENIFSETTTEVDTCKQSNESNIELEGNKALYKNESRDISSVLEDCIGIMDVCNDSSPEGNIINKNEVKIVKNNGNNMGNTLDKVILDDDNYQTANENVQDRDNIENKIGRNTNQIEYTLKENEESTEAFNGINFEEIININKEVTLNQPMDTD